MPSIGRKLQDAAAKARGRRAHKYEIELIPFFVGEVPPEVEQVCFTWERGNKLYVTDAEQVNAKTRACFFKQYLRQQATIYYEGNEVLPKEYSFKIQSVKKNSKGEDERKTIGKVKVDLAQFCDGQVDPQPQDVFLQCKPHGKLKVSIKACWLRDAKIDPDAMTEITQATSASGFGSKYATPEGGGKKKGKGKQQWDEDYHEEGGGDGHEYSHEQDLSGFEHHTQEHDPHSADGQGEEDRRKQRRRERRRRKQMQEEIPEGFEAPVDPDEQQQLQGGGDGEEGGNVDGSARLHKGSQPQGPVGEGMRVHKPSWRDYLCCCCDPRVDGYSNPQEQEQTNLMTQKQAADRDQQNGLETAEEIKKKRKKKKKKDVQDGYGVGTGTAQEYDAVEQELPPWQQQQQHRPHR